MLQVILSPAKTQREDEGLYDFGPQLFPEETERLDQLLRAKTAQELQELWGVSEKLAAKTLERYLASSLRRPQGTALGMYDGLVFKNLAPYVLDEAALDWLRSHLYIISGFYGLLRPDSAMSPYRLEMAAPLHIPATEDRAAAQDLYAYWGPRLARRAAEGCDCLVNLASEEYSKALRPHWPAEIPFLDLRFETERRDKEGQVQRRQITTRAKAARGRMLRFMAERQVESPEPLKDFCDEGFRYAEDSSSASCYVFVQNVH